MSATDAFMPGPAGRVPTLYDVEKGHKSESYIIAITSVSKKDDPHIPVKYSKADEAVDGIEPAPTTPLQPPSTDTHKKERPEDTVGLTIDELEPYRNDPFWKFLRWILFILFWLLWILLFLAAILIVVFNPGCPAKFKPNWWQTSITYHLWVPSFKDSDNNGVGDVKGIVDQLEHLRRIGVKTVWPSPFLQSDNYSDVIRDFKAMNSRFGVNTDAYALIDAVHDKGMKIVIDLPIAVTSNEHEWFLKSAHASLSEFSNFSDFYHWRSSGNPDFYTEYGNTSAFYFHRKHEPNAPVLNWQSQSVRDEIFDVISYWIDKGIDGFKLTDIEYLAGMSGSGNPNWQAIFDILRDIENHVSTYSNSSEQARDKKIILFVERRDASENDKRRLAETGVDSVINYELDEVVKDSQVCSTLESSIGGCVHELLSDTIDFHERVPLVFPVWEFGNPFISRLASRVRSRVQSELLTMVQLLLPWTNSFYYGEEIGMMDLDNETSIPPQQGAMQWDDSKNGGFSAAANPQIPTNPDYKEVNWKVCFLISPAIIRQFLNDKKYLYNISMFVHGILKRGDP
ncbi:hypothetical protein AB6A40_006911 [Gnathostoma spinigerum]|uniref:Glycosyl hydrolase family 13 catalytic domain-containing protein n=1 Tax=Gnathostoma spinigerum TaxID=75299 RepID=A0ABD6ELX5_9BILA